jgi:hypothetical protein
VEKRRRFCRGENQSHHGNAERSNSKADHSVAEAQSKPFYHRGHRGTRRKANLTAEFAETAEGAGKKPHRLKQFAEKVFLVG